MSGEIQESNDVEHLVAQLSKGTEDIDKEDLVGLAKMHGWCAALVAATGPDGDQPDATLLQKATSLAHMLETAILGDAEDPDAAVESIARSAKGLVEQGTAAAPDSTASCSGQKASDEDVAAKLALVFEDEVTCAETVAAQACTQSEGEQLTPPYSDTSAAGVDPLGDLDPTGTETPVKSVEESEPPYEQEPLTIGKNEEDFVVTLRNAKDEPVEITVVEHLFGDWEIYEKSHEYVKKDAHTVEFTITVPGHGETKVTYSSRTVF